MRIRKFIRRPIVTAPTCAPALTFWRSTVLRKRQESEEYSRRRIFGVRRLVAAFLITEFTSKEESGDRSPHSKLYVRSNYRLRKTNLHQVPPDEPVSDRTRG